MRFRGYLTTKLNFDEKSFTDTRAKSCEFCSRQEQGDKTDVLPG